MESLYLLIPIAVIFLVLAVRVLYWAVNSGQYDDLDTEGHRILFDDDPVAKASHKTAVQNTPSQKMSDEQSSPQKSDDQPGESKSK